VAKLDLADPRLADANPARELLLGQSTLFATLSDRPTQVQRDHLRQALGFRDTSVDRRRNDRCPFITGSVAAGPGGPLAAI
jgi:hypothetical protein